jgi:anti-anti-sigma regulatory factor
MQLKVLSDDGDLLRLEMVGRVVDVDVAWEEDPLADLLDDRGYARRVLLSLEDSDHVDSSGLARLLVWHKRFQEAGGKLILHSIPIPVMETLNILRMELVLQLAPDESSAIELARGDCP